MKRCLALCVAFMFGTAASAQQPPKPGPEHEMLKKLVGTWDATMDMGGQKSKGTMTYKMGVGDLWLMSSFEGEFGGMKFEGKGFDSYDANKKKYTGVWIDSMVTSPMNMEGTFDKDTKTLTMSGEGPGMDGKPTKHTMKSTWVDDDTLSFKMFMGDGKDPMFTIEYKRKK